MPKKESSTKCREWERERRQRLNVCFKTLDSLLPNYDPSVNASKIVILQKATSYIRDLQKENRDLLKGGSDKTYWKQVRHLKRRVEDLLRRTQQLSALLRDAGISIPPELSPDGRSLGPRPFKWSNKLQKEDAVLFLERTNKKTEEKKKGKCIKEDFKKAQSKLCINKKEGQIPTTNEKNSNPPLTTSQVTSNNIKEKKAKNLKSVYTRTKTVKKVVGDRVPTVAQLLGLNLNDIDTSPANANTHSAVSSGEKSAKSTLLNTGSQLPPGFIVIRGTNPVHTTSTTQLSQQPCIVVASNSQATKKVSNSTFVPQPIPLVLSRTTTSVGVCPSEKQNSVVAVTNSHLLTAPIMATGIQTCPPPAVLTNPGSGLAGLGPGTLILANGSIVPILPPSQTVLAANSTQIVVNHGHLPTPSHRPVFVMQKSVIATTSTGTIPSLPKAQHPYPLCLPKQIKRQGIDSTRTTFANKVPIPALTSRHHQLIRPQVLQSSLAKVSINKPSSKSDADVKLSDKSAVAKKSVPHTKDNPPGKITKNIKMSHKEGSANHETQLDSEQEIKISKLYGVVSKASDLEESASPSENTEVLNTPCTITLSDSKSSDADRINVEGRKKQVEESSENFTTTLCEEPENNSNVLDLDKNVVEKRKNDNEDPNSSNSKRLKCTEPSTAIADEEVERNTSSEEKVHNQTTSETVLESTSNNLLDDGVQEMSSCNGNKVCNSGSYMIDALCNKKSITESCEVEMKNVNHTSSDFNIEMRSVSCSYKCDSETVFLMSGMKYNNVLQNNHTEANIVMKTASTPVLTSVACMEPIHKEKENSSTISDTNIQGSSTNCEGTVSSETSSSCTTTANSPDQGVQVSTAHASLDSNNMATELSNDSETAAVMYSSQKDQSESARETATVVPDDQEKTKSAPLLKIIRDQLSPNTSNQTVQLKDNETANVLCSKLDSSEEAQSLTKIAAAVTSVDEEIILDDNKELSCSYNSDATAPRNLSSTGLPVSNAYSNYASVLHSTVNAFIPISSSSESDIVKSIDGPESAVVNSSLTLSLQNNEFSNDLFASLQVPTGGQHSESISPTAAFLLAFPLVSTSKVSEMMVDSQEDVGSDSMQGTSTLLQIGNINTDPSHTETITCVERSPAFRDISASDKIPDVPTTTVSSTDQDKQNMGPMQSLDDHAFASDEPSKMNKDQSSEISERSRKLVPANSRLPDKTGSRNWMDLEMPSASHSNDASNSPIDKSKAPSRSVGIQAYASTALTVKSDVSNCTDTILLPTVKSIVPGKSLSFPQTESNSITSKVIRNCVASFNENKSVENLELSSQLSECHAHLFKTSGSDSGPYESFSTSKKQQHLPMMNEVKIPLPVELSQKCHTTSRTGLVPSCSSSDIFPLHTTGNDPKRGANNTKQQTFPGKDIQHTSDDTTCLYPSNVGVLASETSTFHKHQHISEQSTMTEELQCANPNSSYKSDVSSGATIVSNLQDLKYTSNDHSATASTSINNLESAKSVIYSQSSTTANLQPYTTNYFNDYPVITSHPIYTSGYSQSAIGDQNKLSTGVSSFSVAHNSSNLSILSWTTLSPLAAMPNTNQYEFFGGTQNPAVNVPHSFVPGSKGNSNITNIDSTMAITTAPGIHESCQQQEKCHVTMNNGVEDNIHKVPSPFSSNMFVGASDERHSSVLNQDVPTTHLQYQNSNSSRSQTTVAQGEGGHFKFPPSVDAKAHQSRANPSFTGGKQSHHEQQQTHRPPVNWMTTPDIRTSQSSTFPSSSSTSNSLCVNPISSTSMTAIDSSQSNNKDFEFCSTNNSHNLFVGNPSAAIPPFDSRNFSNNTFYSSHSICSYQDNNHNRHVQVTQCQNGENVNHDIKSGPHEQNERVSDITMSQNQANVAYRLSWSQRKAAPIIVPDINFVPSTLPTLVGDLALGTNYTLPMTDDNHINKTFQHPNFHEGESDRKTVMSGPLDQDRESAGKLMQAQQPEKDTSGGSKSRNNHRTHDYRNSAQSSSGSFLSVSQLVDQAKTSRGQTNMARRSSHGNRQPVGANKQANTPQRHQTVTSNNTDISKRGNAAHPTADKDTNRKPSQLSLPNSNNINFPVGVVSLPHSTERERKVSDLTQGSRNNNQYTLDNSSNLVPSLSQSGSGFSMSFNGHGTHPSTSINSSSTSWSSATAMKQTNPRLSASAYKAPVSSYSAEALIGLNNVQSDEGTSSLILDGPGNKMISLPPPMVSERFCHHQNYPHPPPVSRPLQIPPPFNPDTILPGNYFGSVELPVSHQDGSPSSLQAATTNPNNFPQHPHQNQQSYSNNTFNYPKPASAMGSTTGQGNASLYPSSNFIPSVGNGHSACTSTIPSVPISSSFLSDLSGSNGYSGGIIPPEVSNPFILTPSTITAAISRVSSSNRTGNKNRYNLSYAHALVSSVPSHYPRGGPQVSSRSDGTSSQTASSNESRVAILGTSSMPCTNNGSSSNNNRRVSGASSNPSHQQTSHLNGNSCTLSKLRSRRRIPDPIVSTSTSSGIGGLVDLGYLTMPPGIGSPLLADDGMYLNHPGTFLTPGSQHGGPPLYPGGPAPSQGSLYPPPHPSVQSNGNHHNSHHPNHLPPFSSCTTTRTSHHHSTASPNATNSSGTTLANFNLSTIFPEINDKQVASTPSGTLVTVPGVKNIAPPLSTALPSIPTAENIHHGHHPSTSLLPPGMSEYAHRPPAPADPGTCLPPPPPVPLPSNVSFNNLLGSAAPQVCRMQWP